MVSGPGVKQAPACRGAEAGASRPGCDRCLEGEGVWTKRTLAADRVSQHVERDQGTVLRPAGKEGNRDEVGSGKKNPGWVSGLGLEEWPGLEGRSFPVKRVWVNRLLLLQPPVKWAWANHHPPLLPLVKASHFRQNTCRSIFQTAQWQLDERDCPRVLAHTSPGMGRIIHRLSPPTRGKDAKYHILPTASARERAIHINPTALPPSGTRDPLPPLPPDPRRHGKLSPPAGIHVDSFHRHPRQRKAQQHGSHTRISTSSGHHERPSALPCPHHQVKQVIFIRRQPIFNSTNTKINPHPIPPSPPRFEKAQPRFCPTPKHQQRRRNKENPDAVWLDTGTEGNCYLLFSSSLLFPPFFCNKGTESKTQNKKKKTAGDSTSAKKGIDMKKKKTMLACREHG